MRGGQTNGDPVVLHPVINQVPARVQNTTELNPFHSQEGKQPGPELNPLTGPACKLAEKCTHTCLQTASLMGIYNKCTFDTVRFGRSPFTSSCKEGERP